MNIKNKTLTIIGSERSGLAAARVACFHGAVVKISDRKPENQVNPQILNWARDNHVTCEWGAHSRDFILSSDMVVISPGVPFNAEPVRWAKEAGLAVLGEIEFAFQFCDKPVIAVTGSNGKTTVTTLIHKTLEAAGFRSALCGNVGSPFSDHVSCFDQLDYLALEVSSFQMESLLTDAEQKKFGLKGFRPRVSVIINVSQNHLDRHADMNEYIQAKARIFENQTAEDVVVLNDSNAYLKAIAGQARGKIKWFKGQAANPNHETVRAVADVLGIASSVCDRVFADFKGVEHRMELVRTFKGVEFYNDSKATTPEAATWALQRFPDPVFLICGGRDKKVDFTVMREIVSRRVKKALLIGEAREKIRKAFEGYVPVEECPDLRSAVGAALQQAQAGDRVILSPMCTSFDMFKDYEDRGKVFKDIVNGLQCGARSAECVEKPRTTHQEPGT